MRRFLFCLVALTGLTAAGPGWAAEGVWYPAAVHFSTTASDGSMSFDEIAACAAEKGIRILIPTDRDSMRWEFGVWPLRNLLKRVVETNSLAKTGFGAYFKVLASVAAAHPDMVIIPGVETAPFYYWAGSPFRSDFQLCGWHRHLLVFGLSEEDDLKGIPHVANKPALAKSPCSFWFCFLGPLLIFGSGGLLFLRSLGSHHRAALRRRRLKGLGIAVMGLGLVFLINNYPYGFFPYDQYRCDLGTGPFQKVIDYADAKGGLTFWAHPEARYDQVYGRVRVETQPIEDILWQTRDYSGFAVFQEGYERIGRPGGEWDQLLAEYCQGARSRPVWALAGLAFDQGTRQELAGLMDVVRLYVRCDALTPAAVIEAMKRGRMVAARGREAATFSLADFRVKDKASGRGASIGGEVSVKVPVVEITGDAAPQDQGKREVGISVIRNGAVIREFSAPLPLSVSIEDPDCPPGKSFYRLEIRHGDELIIPNPVFVNK